VVGMLEAVMMAVVAQVAEAMVAVEAMVVGKRTRPT